MAQLVLNVDDFEPQRYTRTSLLKRAGFEVVEAATGRQALALARERRPDLVVLDVHLPDISGLEVCRAIKADAACAGTLVLQVSATFRDPEYRVRALDNGADGYLPEPLEADELVAQVRALLRLAAAEAEARRAQKALLEALERAERREAEIQAIYDSAPVGLCIFDVEGRYLRVNRRLAEINNLPPEAHIGRTFREVVPAVADQAEKLLRHVLETGTPARGVEVVGEVPGQPGVIGTWIENWHPLKDAQNVVVGVNVGVVDVTRMKQVEEELRRANRVKDEFLATLSHELRTPLNAILGWSQLLQRGGLSNETMGQALDSIARNATAQSQLISDVLDVSRMVSGKLRLESAEVDLAEIVGMVVESMRPAAQGKDVRLNLACDVESATVHADAARTQQILWNLVSNAVKFTPSGGLVSVSLRRIGSAYEVAVADTGIGIEPEFLPHVFDRFAQADSSLTRSHSGMGLGLSIVKQLTEMQGGRVFAASDGEGKGATFTIVLPARSGEGLGKWDRSAADSPRAADVSGQLAGVRVLILDDIEDARSLVAAVIENAGGEVTLAGTGQEALAALSSSRPDVIVADLAMPSMDGYEFLRRLRALPPAAGGDVPAVALTAYGSAEERAKALDAGFVEHVAKPVMPDHLLHVVARVAGRSV